MSLISKPTRGVLHYKLPARLELLLEGAGLLVLLRHDPPDVVSVLEGIHGIGVLPLARARREPGRVARVVVAAPQLRDAEYEHDVVFGLAMPTEVPGVPSGLLNPRNSWSDTNAYDATAHKLASMFVKNFEKFADQASAEVIAAAPNPSASHAS